MQNLMSTKEAAKYLKLHYVTLYKLAQQGRIPALKVGGSWRFDKDMLDDWVTTQSIAPSGCVLIAADDLKLQEILLKEVSARRFKALAVESCEQALEENRDKQCEVIFIDSELLDKGTDEKISNITENGKDSLVFFISDVTGDSMTNITSLPETWQLMKKPLDPQAIAEALDFAELHLQKVKEEKISRIVAEEYVKPQQMKSVTRNGRKSYTHRGRTPSKSTRTDHSDPRYREWLDQLPETVFEANAEGNITYANKAALETFGYTGKDLERGVNVLDIVTPEERTKAMASIEKVLSGEQSGINEFMVQRKDGIRFQIVMHANPVVEDGGNVIGFRGLVVNIRKSDQLEELLWESEEELRITFESISDAIVITDLTGRITEANDAAVRMGGFNNKEELIGLSAFDLIAPADRSNAMETLKSRLGDGTIREHVEYKLLIADGTEIDAAVSVSLLRDDRGNPKGLVAVVRDITESKQAEEALRQSEENYRTTFEGMIDGVVVIDAETMRVVLANKRAFDMHGFDPSENISEINLLDHVHPDDRERAIKSLAVDMFENDLRQVVEFRTFTKTGELKWVSGVGTKITYQGRTSGLVSFRDITERKRAEEALRQSEENYRVLFEESPSSVTIVDTDGLIRDCNEATEKLTGFSRDEIIGKRFNELLTLNPAEVPRLTSYFNKLLKGKAVEPYELEIIKKDGSRCWITVRNSLFKKDAEVRYIQVSAIDITGHKRAEEALQQSTAGYKAIFDGIIEGVIILDAATMQISMCNNVAAQTYGFDSVEDVIGLNPLEFIHPDDRERASKIILEDMFVHDLRQVNELRTITRAGNEKWISAMGTLIEYQGKRAGLISFRDITSLKKAWDVLRDNEEKMRIMFDSIEEAITITDLHGVIIDANQTTVRNSGYGCREELIGHCGLEFISEKDRERCASDIMEAVKTGRRKMVKYTFVDKDGGEYQGWATGSLLRDSCGNPIGFINVAKATTKHTKKN